MGRYLVRGCETSAGRRECQAASNTTAIVDPRSTPFVELLSLVGAATKVATDELARALQASPRSDGATPLVELLAEQLKNWPDEHAANVVRAISGRIASGDPPDLEALRGWLTAHGERPDLVPLCIEVRPPDQIVVLEVLSTAGSQKIVFRGKWAITDRDIVLKQVRVAPGSEAVGLRELQPHPLSIEHPNIIETHLLLNDRQERFFAERYLTVLTDDWRAAGANEAANLLHDIASALQFVHDCGWIHGDVKPDNIGYEQRRYVLLDFGICRPEGDFHDTQATGSLRTRAPELLDGGGRHSAASDVWALGATVFNVALGRFPLYDASEPTPRVWDAEARAAHEEELGRRAREEYDRRVVEPLGGVRHAELRRLLAEVLVRDPLQRPTAAEIAARCRSRLSSLVRVSDAPGRLSVRARLAQLERLLPETEPLVSSMPSRKLTDLRGEVRRLATLPWARGVRSHRPCRARAAARRERGRLMPSQRVQRLQDAVHGLMEFRGLETTVIEALSTRELQRLRRVRQLGLGYLVFPSAEHSRLAHALGAAHLAIRFARRIEDATLELLDPALRPDQETRRDLALAALCHDIGARSDVARLGGGHAQVRPHGLGRVPRRPGPRAA